MLCLDKIRNHYKENAYGFERCAQEKKKLGTRCVIHPALVAELKEMLGEENVVIR